jgi:hypothetical protein
MSFENNQPPTVVAELIRRLKLSNNRSARVNERAVSLKERAGACDSLILCHGSAYAAKVLALAAERAVAGIPREQSRLAHILLISHGMPLTRARPPNIGRNTSATAKHSFQLNLTSAIMPRPPVLYTRTYPRSRAEECRIDLHFRSLERCRASFLSRQLGEEAEGFPRAHLVRYIAQAPSTSRGGSCLIPSARCL